MLSKIPWLAFNSTIVPNPITAVDKTLLDAPSMTLLIAALDKKSMTIITRLAASRMIIGIHPLLRIIFFTIFIRSFSPFLVYFQLNNVYIYDGITDWLQFHFLKNSLVMIIENIKETEINELWSYVERHLC
jgi:hypothetical protein